MADIRSPLSKIPTSFKLTDVEFLQSIRFMASIEHEASQLFKQRIEANRANLSAEVLEALVEEEREHVERFRDLLLELAADVENFYPSGIYIGEDNLDRTMESHKATTNPKEKVP